jgi:beta-barrel assembly-enhancing protease
VTCPPGASRVPPNQLGGILAIALALLPTPVQASPRDAAFATLRAQDQRVADIAHRLAVRGVPHCPGRMAPQTGIRFHGIGQYGEKDRDAAATYFRFGLLPAALAVAKGSTAERAGVRIDDAFVEIDEISQTGESYAGIERSRAILTAALRRGAARLKMFRPGLAPEILIKTIESEPGCLSEVELIPSRKLNASADGRIVQITTGVLEQTRDDAELAFVIAHEMAHNILRHPETPGARRHEEIEADRLAIKLMIASGYDADAAARFWTRFGKKTGSGIFSDGTHLRTKARVALLEQLAAQFTAQ